MKKPNKCFRLHPDLVRDLEAEAERTGESHTDIATHALTSELLRRARERVEYRQLVRGLPV